MPAVGGGAGDVLRHAQLGGKQPDLHVLGIRYRAEPDQAQRPPDDHESERTNDRETGLPTGGFPCAHRKAESAPPRECVGYPTADSRSRRSDGTKMT